MAMSSLKSLVNVSHVISPFQLDGNSNGVFLHAPYIITAALFVLFLYSRRESYPELPRLNPKKPTELTWRSRLLDWMGRSPELLAHGDRQFGDRPCKFYTEVGDVLIVPPRYVDELKSNRAMDFAVSSSDVSLGAWTGSDISLRVPTS